METTATITDASGQPIDAKRFDDSRATAGDTSRVGSLARATLAVLAATPLVAPLHMLGALLRAQRLLDAINREGRPARD